MSFYLNEMAYCFRISAGPALPGKALPWERFFHLILGP